MGRVTIFLSHSSKDIQKVRQIRDILESLDYEPLLFYLKCLDDDNENLEAFIKKEIEARNIFIYCKSESSEKSKWVQKELEYIKSFDAKRLFTIDITRPFKDTMVQLLQSVTDIVKKNRIFISCSRNSPDRELGDVLEKFLTEQNFDVVRYRDVSYLKDLEQDGVHTRALSEAHTFLAIISPNSRKSVYCTGELECVLAEYQSSREARRSKIVPLYFGIGASLARKLLPAGDLLAECEGIQIAGCDGLTADEKAALLQILHR